MSRLLSPALPVLLFGCATMVCAPAVAQEDARLIVKLKPDAAKSAFTAKASVERLGASAGLPLRHLREMALGAQVIAAAGAHGEADAERVAAKLAADPGVEFAVVDRRRHALATAPVNDEFAVAQRYLNNDPNSISAYAAWDVTHGSADTVVAVVDTGYRPHADLAGRILPGYDMISGVTVANDGDGRDPDASDPGDWLSPGENTGNFASCSTGPSTWHGTAIAGIIAADTNNHIWTAGIDWLANILPVRVLGKCGGFDSDIADGIAWAAGLAVPGVPANPHPAQVINLSLGGDGTCSPVYPAVAAAAYAHGITRAIIAAAGNDSNDVANHTPANCPGYYAVASTSPLSGDLAAYSNFGSGITISAPGGTFNFSVQGDAIIVLSNAGLTTPGADSFRLEGGTSLAAPMVSGTVSLMLAVAPWLTADQVHSIIVGTAKPFAIDSTCSTSRCGAGIVDAGAAVRAAAAVPAPTANYEGLWWASPAGSESGWGINFAHQGDVIVATWFTYDLDGTPLWLIAPTNNSAPGVFAGTLYRTTGPAFNAMPFNPDNVVNTVVGTARFTFTDNDNATFAYTVNGVSQSKPITREVFGPLPTCSFGTQPNLALATNYQDLWWAAPAGSESGWGINLTHEGSTIVATWFTYDLDGTPLWLIVPADNSAPGVFSGTLYRTTGPAFNAMPFNPDNVVNTPVGAATFTFSDGNHATFAYTVNGVSQSKAITREVFRTPGTVCQ